MLVDQIASLIFEGALASTALLYQRCCKMVLTVSKIVHVSMRLIGMTMTGEGTALDSTYLAGD